MFLQDCFFWSLPEQDQNSDEDYDPAEGLVSKVGQEGEVNGGAAAAVVRWDNLCHGWLDSILLHSSCMRKPT